MTATLIPTEQQADALVIHFSPPLRRLSDDEFFDFCMANKDLRIELTSAGDLIIMPPTGGKTGIRNFELIGYFWAWTNKDGTGRGFDSSTVFSLPNGAKRSPDLSWVKKERWESLTEKEREKFSPICPDFVVELRSPSDSLRHLQQKMEEYIANGAQLGWLIDPFERKVHVYRPQANVEVLDDPETVPGEPLLPGFTLDVRALFE
ncbi:MAG TPA: Uma2 family endonuclease [Pyrinomonadaceae bacterium]